MEAYFKGENAKLPRRKTEAPTESKEIKLEETSTIEADTINGVSEPTVKLDQADKNFNSVEGISEDEMEKDKVHNTKTNLFVDEDYPETVLGEENPQVTLAEEVEAPKEEKVSNDTIVIEPSNEGVFNASEETKLKEDKDDI